MTNNHDNLRRNWILLLMLLSGIVWLIFRGMHYSNWTDDDAFISFRYARNLAQGHGLVYNLDEQVEGYSNFLWTVIMAASYSVQNDLPAAARFLGVSFSILTILLLLGFREFKTGRPESPSNYAPHGLSLLLVCLLLCLNDSWAAWSVGGLENVLSGFLVAAGFLAYFRFLEPRPSHSSRSYVLWLAAISFALAILNHPSNGIFALLIASHLAWGRRWRSLLSFAVPIVLLTSVHVSWRWSYYHDLLPNTYYVKTGFTLAILLRGLRYCGEIFAAFPMIYLVTFGVCFLAARRQPQNTRASLLAFAILGYLMYIIWIGGEQFPAFRLLVVTAPLAAMLQGDLFSRWSAGKRREISALIFFCILAANTVPPHMSPRIEVLNRALEEGRTALSMRAADMLKDLLPENSLFAHSGAGLLAYYTNFPWIDTLGLTDHHIARTSVPDMGHGAAGHEKGDGRYVFSRQPDYIMFAGYPISNRRPGTKGGREMYAMQQFHQLYRSRQYNFRYHPPNKESPQTYSIYIWEKTR